MSVCFIVASADNRVHLLNECIRCYRQSVYCADDIYCYFQGDHFHEVEGRDIFKAVIIDSRMRGVFTPRYELMKQYALQYDYTIIIDDDLFVGERTDYYRTIRTAEKLPFVGCINIANSKIKPTIEKVTDINIEGGMIFPRKSVEIILDYFADKEMDYTFDTFWLLLWVKGYDWYKDWRSYADHKPVRKKDGEYTGYNESLVKLDYHMMMPEWFDDPPVVFRHGRNEHLTPTLKQAKASAYTERRNNLIALGRI